MLKLGPSLCMIWALSHSWMSIPVLKMVLVNFSCRIEPDFWASSYPGGFDSVLMDFSLLPNQSATEKKKNRTRFKRSEKPIN